MGSQSPQNAEIIGMSPQGYFHQRNQSQDVNTLNNKQLKNKMQQRKRAMMLPSGVGSAGGSIINDEVGGDYIMEDPSRQQYI